MSYFLFVDESGGDRQESPYEVLAGIAVEDRNVWNLIDAIKKREETILGLRYAREIEEIKGKKFLKRKVFRQAGRLPLIPAGERQALARQCLLDGSRADLLAITALAQAKIALVEEILDLCANFQCRAFASIVDRDAPRPVRSILRKDYAFLFERFFYFLEDRGPAAVDYSGAIFCP